MDNINLNAESSASQSKQILCWLESGHTITGLEALQMFGTMSLPRRICDIKEKGVKVAKTTIVLPSGKRVAQYSIQR